MARKALIAVLRSVHTIQFSSHYVFNFFSPNKINVCSHERIISKFVSLLNLEIIILAKRSYDPINQKHANEAEPACLVETGGAHKHLFDRDARPRTNFNYLKK